MAVIATGRYSFTQTLSVIVGRTAQLLHVSKQSFVQALTVTPGSDGDDEALAQLAAMANRINGMILADIPSLRRVTDTVTVSASGNEAAIPDEVHRNQIMDVQYSNEGNVLDLMPIQFIGKVDRRRLWPRILNGQYTGTYAQVVALDDTEENLLFYPFLNTSTTFNVLFQQAPDSFVGDDVWDDASTTFAVVPDEYNDVFPTFMAIECAKIMGKRDRARELQEDLQGTAANGFMGIYETFARAMGIVPANEIDRRYGYSNAQVNALTNPFAGEQFGNRYRQYTR